MQTLQAPYDHYQASSFCFCLVRLLKLFTDSCTPDANSNRFLNLFVARELWSFTILFGLFSLSKPKQPFPSQQCASLSVRATGAATI